MSKAGLVIYKLSLNTPRIPLLALPGLGRASVEAAVPGLAGPRIEALLRSMPKDARRSLIPIGDTALQFLTHVNGSSGAVPADPQSLSAWLKERKGLPDSLLRFDPALMPAHLTPQLVVLKEGRELARGASLPALRRECAGQARAELDRRARAIYGPAMIWQRFDLEELPAVAALDLDQGQVSAYPTVVRTEERLEIRLAWSPAEAARDWEGGAVALARRLLERQSRDLSKALSADMPFLLGASPYVQSPVLIDAVLQMTFRRACFGDRPAPRARVDFERAVEAARPRLHPEFEDITASLAAWFAEARTVRRHLAGPRAALLTEAVAEAQRHLQRLLSAADTGAMPADWLRQVPRFLKAEERRWQRIETRGGESPHILRELNAWSARHQLMASQLEAEMRWIPQLDELQWWIEEYRVSLYAQELKTLGPISPARLEQRAGEIEAGVQR